MTDMTPERLAVIRDRIDHTGYAPWKNVTSDLLDEVERLRAGDAAGLLATPEHDAAVAAKALRDAADEIRQGMEFDENDQRVDEATRSTWRAVGEAFAKVNERRADRIERGD